MSTTIACIQGAHAVAAHLMGPHWLMSDDDAKNYANAINNVARHYDVGAAQKTIDICNFIGLTAFYEGTRLLYTRQQAGRPQPPPRSADIVPIFKFDPPFPPAAAAPGGGTASPATVSEHPTAAAMPPEEQLH